MSEEATVHWECYPLASSHNTSHAWLQIQANFGLAPNTIDAYARGLEDYLHFSLPRQIQIEQASKEHVASYVHDLLTRPHLGGSNIRSIGSRSGLANATLQQRLTVIRLYYDYLIEEGLREYNPVGRGKYTSGKGFAGKRERGLIPRYKKLPWIPTEAEWQRIIQVAKAESLRNRVMLALAYDAALRREEVCSLEIRDLDPPHRIINIRAEITKNRLQRVAPYSTSTSVLLVSYIHHRSQLSRSQGLLFLSESHRNHARPISIWTWSKVVESIARRAEVPRFSTHTLRHLCLTDLARAGWDIHEIATFAGHRNTQTTLQYIHLSGRELSLKLANGMNSIHERRVRYMVEALA